jgi:hypothetical protein
MSLLLMAKSTRLIASSRIRNMLNPSPRSTSGSLCTTITACQSAREGQDFQGGNPEHNSFNLIRVPRGCELTGTESVNAHTTSVPNQAFIVHRRSACLLCAVSILGPRRQSKYEAPLKRRGRHSSLAPPRAWARSELRNIAASLTGVDASIGLRRNGRCGQQCGGAPRCGRAGMRHIVDPCDGCGRAVSRNERGIAEGNKLTGSALI